jgi:2-haloacid dehalogenase
VALAITALRRGLRVDPDDEGAILAGVRTLPPHPDVRPALERLRSAGYRLAALTNSTAEVEEAQLRNARLADLFEKALSADTGKRLKPAAEAYANAAGQLGVPIAGMRLVAAHDWDVQGALRAGCAAAFVERPGAVWNPLLERPDIVGPDLGEIAERVIEVDR